MTTRFDTGLPATPTLKLPVCGDCGRVSYPIRELCGHCLADALQWQVVQDAGVVQALTQLHYSLEPNYAGQLPWRVASVRLDCGAIAFAHLQPEVEQGENVTVRIVQDPAGSCMLCALSADSGPQAAGREWLKAINFEEIAS